MEILTKIYNLANATATAPTSFGSFHLTFVAIIILLTTLVSMTFKNCSERAVNRLTAFVWVVILILEIYKQLVFSIHLTDGAFSWDYAWYSFPFQFCSSPLYILPIIAFTKNQRLRDCCIAYMMTFSLFAGLAVFCYPNDVFCEWTGINYQTMIHHGSQILMGVFYAVRYRRRMNVRFFFGGVFVFIVMVLIAMVLNVSVHHYFSLHGIGDTFNMFYISPYFPCTLPLLSIVWEKLPYIPFACLYFFGFILCAAIVYSVERGLTKSARRSAIARTCKRLARENDCIFYYNM